jgi:hypothetical protein
LIDLQAALTDASDAADRLPDCDVSWEVGLELLDARKAVNAVLDALERATAPTIGPRWAPTIVRNAVLDQAYVEVDLLFA